ncbi:MAG: hypothetical protein K6T86_12190 [Pirellulales bacterium]|nr:hypothetical protein [Pirellulales bacterium]
MTTQLRFMPKAMCIAGLVVSSLVLLLVGLDLVLGWPFSKASTTLDVGFLIAALLLAYASWTTYREQG